ncbi:MAG: hypothetical protein ACK4M9_21805 [Anaerobacillus sp.]|uniref:hypothetical protein n=1 Tax=Anaerobacillus sp. TaxID=1872506 RepID=UPI00391CAFDB
MKKCMLGFICTTFVLLLLMTGCNQKPDIDISESLSDWREEFREYEEVDTVAAAFDGSDIKLRIMVEGHPTEEEAIKLFRKMEASIVNHSNYSAVWDYYNGHFSIINYDNGVIYEATNLIGDDLKIVSK